MPPRRSLSPSSRDWFWTVKRLIEYGTRTFREHGIAFGHGTLNARDEAAYLALHTLNLTPEQAAGRWTCRVSASRVAAVRAVFARRILERKPASYLTHEAWLGDYKFYIDERAIVPRSYIADLLREDLAPWITDPRAVRRALDLCTGSGCLAVLMAHSFERAAIDATDVSPHALDVAHRNVGDYRLGRRIRLIQSDLFGALHGERYDLIVANPPYVRAAIMRRLPREHRCEPALALAGGSDGLEVVRRILLRARRHLNPSGLLVVEVGHNRRRLERAYPHLAFTWPETGGGDDCVFVLSRQQLTPLTLASAQAPAAVRSRRRRRDDTPARA